jgi:rare lipoprotein A
MKKLTIGIILFLTPILTIAQSGIASYYGEQHQGKRTASGEIFNMNKLTAAHRTLPFGTLVKVTNMKNHLFVIVRINDRGPFIKGRIIDLSKKASKEINMNGITTVNVEVI